jgi:ribokinase
MVTRLAEGATVREAMVFANKASSVTVTRKGAQQAIPYRNEIM